MNKITKDFLNLISEEIKFKSVDKEEKEAKKTKTPKVSAKSSTTEYNRKTSNKLSLGRPLSNSALADARFRSEGSAEDATGLLKDLKIQKPSGDSWQQKLKNVVNGSRSGNMSALIRSGEVVKNSKGKEGVLITLREVWKQDDNNGKLSYSFIRSLIVASNRAGYIKMSNTLIKNLRLELVDGTDEFIAYSGKANSWSK